MKWCLLLFAAAVWLALFPAPSFADSSEFAEAMQKALQGDPEAQVSLGSMYLMGEGVASNEVEASKWYLKAADQGDPGAQFYLGLMYEKGTGVPRDQVEAVRWYHKAADQGIADAQSLLTLGNSYYKGEGAARNYVEAYIWLSLAAAKGQQQAKGSLDSLEGRMMPDQIAEAQKRAAELGELVLQLPQPPIPPVDLTEKEISDIIEKVAGGETNRMHQVWGYGNKTCGEFVSDQATKNGDKVYLSWLSGYVTSYNKTSDETSAVFQLDDTTSFVGIFCRSELTYRLDWATAIEVSYESKQLRRGATKGLGYGAKSCGDYIVDRSSKTGDHSFLDWIAGYLTEYDINESLDGIEIESVISSLDEVCQADHSVQFDSAAAAVVASEARRQSHSNRPGSTVEQPSTKLAPQAGQQPSASYRIQGQPLVQVPFPLQSRVASENQHTSPNATTSETVDVKYRGPVSLAPFKCSSITRSSFIERVCYDAANSYMLINLGGVWYHYCEIDGNTVAALLQADSMGSFFNTSIKGNFDCRTHRVPPY